MKQKKRKGFIINSIKGIKIMLKTEPKMLLIHSCITIAHGLSWALQVVFTQIFFDTAENMVQEGTDYNHCFFALVGMVLAYGFCQVMNGLDNCHSRVLNLALARHVNLLIFKRIDKINCIDFENTERLNYINKAIYGGGNFFWVSLTLLDTIFFYTTYFVFMSWYLFTLKPILCISILLVFIPCLFSNIIQMSTFKNLENKSAPVRRECTYYEECVADIRETRLLGVTNYFKTLYKISLQKLNHLVLIAQVKKNSINFALDTITGVGYCLIIYMIFIFVMRQEISIGAFTAVLTSIGRLYSFMSEVISERIGWAIENVPAAENFFDFIEEESQAPKSINKPQKPDIMLKNISFRYPSVERDVLNNISLTIKSGQTVAIVGENGSGKTTLCRLILGIYQPTSGEIFYDNVSGSNVSHNNDSAIFQNYCKYKFTLKENIHISQMDKFVTDEAIEGLCEQSGLNITDEKFISGVNTMLGRDFGGIELSGGQWQRIAIARGLFRPSNLIVLDEPTAAIDPLEESRLYRDFVKICHNKTALIVTHRLGSVRIADRIIVLKDGKIVEDGTHDELISLDGEYKRLFETQKKWYV